MIYALADIRPHRLVTARRDISAANELLGDLFEHEDLDKITAFAFVEHPELSDAMYFSIDHQPAAAAAKYFAVA